MPAEPPLSSKYIDENRTEPKLSLKIQLDVKSNDFGEMGVNVHWLLSVKCITYLNCVFFSVLSRLLFPTELTWLHFFFKYMPTFLRKVQVSPDTKNKWWTSWTNLLTEISQLEAAFIVYGGLQQSQCEESPAEVSPTHQLPDAGRQSDHVYSPFLPLDS